MKKFFQAAATALTGLAILGLSASSAVASPSEGSIDAHIALVQALQNEGVTVIINADDCKADFDGYYSGDRRVLVVCQDNGVAGGPAVNWTANDLDTLRHEAQHFIQDCMVGGDHDGYLGNVYRDPIALAGSRLSQAQSEWIVGQYRSRGVDDRTILLELEAFSVAGANVPLDQTNDISNYCSGF